MMVTWRRFFQRLQGFCSSFFRRLARRSSTSGLSKAPPAVSYRLIGRSTHNVSRKHISEKALRVLYRLHKSGFRALLVGGGVRDLLVGQIPKDFDIATDAHPEQVHALFRNCRLIGRRFRLAHVHFGQEVIEVATFRGGDTVSDQYGMVIRDNVYGQIEQDVLRRDFTINALYYDISNFGIIDYVHGWEDLKKKLIRTIGNAKERFTEDPVRIMRAIRLAAKLDFNFSPDVEEAIDHCKHLIPLVPKARLFEEYSKTFLSGHALKNFKYWLDHGIMSLLFPSVNWGALEPAGFTLCNLVVQNTDLRVNAGKTNNPAFLLAVFLWLAVVAVSKSLKKQQNGSRANLNLLYNQAMERVLNQQQQSLGIHKRFVLMIKEIWILSFRMKKRSTKAIYSIFGHPKFRTALDFLELLKISGFDKEAAKAYDWWHQFSLADETQKQSMVSALLNHKKKG